MAEEDMVKEGDGDKALEEKLKGKVEAVKEALLSGISKEQLIEQGLNRGTVRACALQLEKAGLSRGAHFGA